MFLLWFYVCVLHDFTVKTQTTGQQWDSQEGDGQVKTLVIGKNTAYLHSRDGRWSGKEREAVC